MPEHSPTRFTMVPARRSNEPTARRRARRILNMLFLASALSIVAAVVALAKGSPKTDLSGIDPQGRGLAYTAAVNHLMGSLQNVPHAGSYDPEEVAGTAVGASRERQSAPFPYQSLSWTGFTPQHFGSKKAGFTDFEVHHFLVIPEQPRESAEAQEPAPSPSSSASPSEETGPSPAEGPDTTEPEGSASNVLRLDVTILLTSKGPRLASAPAFSAWRGGIGDEAGRGDYTNYGSLVTDVSDAVKTQVAQWAKAYVNGDSAGLLALTGDQDRNHRYLGLSGFTLPDSDQAVQILSAIKAGRGQLVVRARVLLTKALPGVKTPEGKTPERKAQGDKGTAQRFATYSDFDLLVGGPTGAQPPILAWGPGGSAAELEPYANALTS